MMNSKRNRQGRPVPLIAIVVASIWMLAVDVDRVRAGNNAWTQIPIEGASVTKLIVDGDAIFASARNGDMFLLPAGADRWNRLSRSTTGETASVPSTVEVVRDDAILAEGSLRLFRSVDRGGSWVPALPNRFVMGVAEESASGDVFAVAFESVAADAPEFLRSSDGGQSWTTVGPVSGIAPAPRRGLLDVVGDQVYFLDGLSSLQAPRLARSQDGGKTFDVVFGGPPRPPAFETQRVDPENAQILYRNGRNADTLGGGCLFRSVDRGSSWQRTTACFEDPIFDIAIDRRRPGRLLLSLLDRLIDVRDRGDRWTEIPSPSVHEFQYFGAIQAGPDEGTVIVNREAEDAILITRDGGESWQALTQGLNAVEAESVGFGADGRIVVGTTRGIYTVDGTVVEQRIVWNAQIFKLAIEPFGGDQTAAVDALGRLLTSRDGGQTWPEQSFSEFVTVSRHGRETAQLRGNGAIDRSTDGGETFEPLLTFSEASALGVAPPIHVVENPRPGQLHAGFSIGLLSSFDDGLTWERASGDVPQNVTGIWTDPFDSDRVLLEGGSGFAISESLDGGRTWTGIAPDFVAITRPNDFAFDPAVPGRLFAAGAEGVERSDDGGVTWQAMNDGLDRRFVWDLAIDPRRPTELVAGTARGPYVFSLLGPCVPNETTLCIDDRPGDGRFAVRLRFDTALGGGRVGQAPPIALSALGVDRGGLLHFGNPASPEVLVKVLDGCAINGHFWVFASAATTLGFEMSVQDRSSGAIRTYGNPDISRASTVTDTRAFATCDATTSSSAQPQAYTAEAAAATHATSVTTGTCVADATTLCIDDEIGDRRFRVRMRFESAQGGGASGDAGALPLDALGVARGGLLHFGNPRNPEVVIKVLDGCSTNGRHWVFASAATSLGFEITVDDTLGGVSRRYRNADGTAALAIADTQAFATCGAE